VSVLVDFFQGLNAAPLSLSNNGGTVSLSLPNTGPNSYGLLFGMKAGSNSLDIGQVFGNANPPDPATGQFTYTPTIAGQTYTITGTLLTSTPVALDTVIPNLQGFAQVGLFSFNATGGPSLTFSVTDPNGHVINFDDPDHASGAPEPASLALAGLGVAGLAGYGWRRRRAA
jgi:hypothetical protein